MTKPHTHKLFTNNTTNGFNLASTSSTWAGGLCAIGRWHWWTPPCLTLTAMHPTPIPIWCIKLRTRCLTPQ